MMRRPLFVFVFLCIVVGPLSVEAGIFSGFFNSTEIQPEEMTASVVGGNAQTIPLLRAALHTDPNPAKGGGDILVEDGALVASGDIHDDEEARSLTANGEISLYTVREGDTLSQIAEMFDVSAKTILWANDIKDASIIRPGSTLVILPITGVRHVVKKGDTISTIAKKYDGDVEDILAYNQLASANDISIGDTIVVPGGEMVAPTPTRRATPVSVSGNAVAVSGAGSSGFVNPLPGSIKTQGLHGYNGVDLGASIGAPVHAAGSGSVIVARSNGAWNGGYGNYIVVKHANGVQTLYAHLSSVSVGVGQQVSAGETIGAVGNTGRSTGPHLHFEVRGAKNPF